MVEPWGVDAEDDPWDFPRRGSSFGRPVSSPSTSRGRSSQKTNIRKSLVIDRREKKPGDDSVKEPWPEKTGKVKRKQTMTKGGVEPLGKGRSGKIKLKKSAPGTTIPSSDIRILGSGPTKVVSAKGKQYTKEGTITGVDDLPLLDGNFSKLKGMGRPIRRPRSSVHGREMHGPRPHSTPLWREVDHTCSTLDVSDDGEDSGQTLESNSFLVPPQSSSPYPMKYRHQKPSTTPPDLHPPRAKESVAKTIVMSDPFHAMKKGSKKKPSSPPSDSPHGKLRRKKLKKRIKNKRGGCGCHLRSPSAPLKTDFLGSDLFEMEQIVAPIGIVRLEEMPIHNHTAFHLELGEHERCFEPIDEPLHAIGGGLHSSPSHKSASPPRMIDQITDKRPKSVGCIGDHNESNDLWWSKTPAYRRLMEKAGKLRSASSSPTSAPSIAPLFDESEPQLTFFAIQGKSIA